MISARQDLSHYNGMADLFEYPDKNYTGKVIQVIRHLEKRYPEATVELNRFLDLLPTEHLETLQELFIRSFDVQAVTTLDLGYVLFGDDYKRGELLANLNREHRNVHNDCGHELADHLPNLLRLLPKLKDQPLTHELVKVILVPALLIMTNEFSPKRIQEKQQSYQKHYKTLIETPQDSKGKESATLYQFALKALTLVLKSDFLQSVGREIKLEEKER